MAKLERLVDDFQSNHKGMTLIEVLIALALFSTFIIAFMSGQGNNINTSIRFKEELQLRDIAEVILNEQMIEPPEVKITAGNVKIDPIQSRKFKTFEDNEQYEYAINTYKISIPDFDKIVDTGDKSQEENQQQGTEKLIYNKFKENMEKLVFQIIITVRHKTSGQVYDLSTWFYKDGEVKLGI
jgi:type II secretion system protein I